MTVQTRPQTQVALRSPVVTGAVAAAWAVVLGVAVLVAVAVLVWLVAPHGSAGVLDAGRAGILAWLAADGATLQLGGVPVDLVPLGLVAVPLAALYATGRWAGRVCAEAPPAAAAATVTQTVAYTIAAAVVASLENVDPAPVAVGAALAAVVAGGAGVLSGGALWDEVVDRLPEPAVPVLRGAAAGLAVLVGGGALLVTVSLLAHFGRVADLSRTLQAGAGGGAGLLLLGVLALPSAAVWGAAYAVGPGFSVGVGTSVAPSGVALGPVPDLPVLGALPGTGPAPAVSLLALAVPLVAGLVVGLLAARRPAGTHGRTAAEALVAGVLAGLVLGLLATLSGGSVGSVRMSELGPDGLRVGAAAALEVGAVAAAVAWESCRHRAALQALVRRARHLAARPGGRAR